MQNILVVSTSSEHNAKTYAGVEAIFIGSANYEVSSYLAAPDNTCKGFINIDLAFDHDQLRSLIVQPRNPKALEARRMKNSSRVVILFNGLKVPNYVICGLKNTDTRSSRRNQGLPPELGPLPQKPRKKTVTMTTPPVVVLPVAAHSSKVEHSFVEIIPSGRLKCSIFILDIYSLPKDLKQRFAPLISRAAGKAGGSPLIVAGDFNVLHRAWGYSRATRRGDDLWQAAANHEFPLVTDPTFPTRIGNSCSTETTPDFTFVKNVGAVSWHNLNEDLGISQSREEWALIPDSSIDQERWAKQLEGGVKSATKTVQTDLEIARMDSRLAHLLETEKAIFDRWKGQRLNRRLRKKIAEVNRTIEDHCQSLTRQQWDEVCNSVDG
ncbi:hypothetical protein HPB47_015255 [Ixodes persulcatus]|uniref:Uncharacterized protein n=1 Tax=Ixodes persulcatus TaxID=34615 RepID=A0AC60QUV7_IXOPE|nr:hypothetical protein HPB47_015255 [Ixodes persulcatus]